MDSRKRLLTVLQGKKPDRVPVTLFIVDQGHFLEQVYPDVAPWDFESLQLKVIDIQKQLGCDVFVRQLFGLTDPLHIHMGGLDVTNQNENWQVETKKIQKDSTVISRSVITTPQGQLSQDFSINQLRDKTYMYACTKKPIQSFSDLQLAIKYEPRMPKDWPAHARKWVSRLRKALGDDGILGVWAPHGPFNNASLLIDHERLYSLFITDPDFYDQLMKFATERILDYSRAIERTDADILCVGGNVPGGFLGKDTYDRYVLPYEKKYINFLQKNGKPAMYHNCGQIMNLVESYKNLEAKVVEPFSPCPLGDADDLEKVRKIVNSDYIVLSGIDQVNVLQKGSVDDVKKATEQRIKAGKANGGFIFQPVDFLEYQTPLENIEAFIKTAKENADY